jgi:signal transduction histidine kinase
MAQLERDEQRERERLADTLERRGNDIIDRWLERVRTDASARDIPITDLRDGIADYLHTMATMLRSDVVMNGMGALTWDDVAKRHALTRVRLGFDVAQLTQELRLLRRTAYEILCEEDLADKAQRLLELIDDAEKATLRSYINFRDYETRRLEAEHVGFLTHELKTPLGAIVLVTDNLQAEGLTPAQKRLCAILDRNIERMRRMIDEVLLSERLGIGEIASKPVDVKLGALISDRLEQTRSEAAKKRVGFRAGYDESLRLHVDPALTMSAIDNLLDNAVKFTERGEVSFVVEELPDQIVFHVHDRCDGLSPEELRVIFEPFKRAHSHKPGSGLGLAIARRAVEAQGGEMHAESKETGCHFWFTLPKTHH